MEMTAPSYMVRMEVQLAQLLAFLGKQDVLPMSVQLHCTVRVSTIVEWILL